MSGESHAAGDRHVAADRASTGSVTFHTSSLRPKAGEAGPRHDHSNEDREHLAWRAR